MKSIMTRVQVVQCYGFAGVTFANLPSKDEVNEFPILNGYVVRIKGLASKKMFETEQVKGA
jgi:hypothetical protein